MRDREEFPDSEPKPQELEEARRLAEALEGGKGAGADPKALASAHLLQSLAESIDADEVSHRRIRRELVAAAAKRRPYHRVRWISAAASLLAAAALGVTLWRVWSPPGEKTLQAREREARLAVASIARVSVDDLSSSRSEASYDDAWRERLVTALEESRYESLIQQAGGNGSSSASSGSRRVSGGEL